MKSPLGQKLVEDQDAQTVFHRVLLPKLVDRGASSKSEVQRGGLKLFELPLETAELEDVLELARRKRLVEPIEDRKDVYGNPIDGVEWLPTSRGRELRRQQGLTLAAFKNYVIEVSPAGPKVATAVQGVLALLVTVPVFQPLLGNAGVDKEASASLVKGGVAIGIVLGLFLAVMLVRGMRSEAQLRHAAIAWERLRDRWPEFWKWQVSQWRPWLCLVGVVLFVSPGVIRLIDGDGHLWLLIPYVSGLCLLGILWVIHQRRTGTRAAAAPGPPPAEPAVADG